jgi:hypothetical protein
MTAAPPKPGQLIPIIVGDSCKGFLFRRRGALFDPKGAR